MKYFLFNHEGSCNHGCEAIIHGTQKIIDIFDKNSEIILSSHNPQSDVNFSNIEVAKFQPRELKFFEKIVAKINLMFRQSEDYAIRKMYSPIVKQAKNADVCLSVGGDTYCYGDNYAIQVLTKELKKKGKKVFLWGTSVGQEDLDEKKLKSLENFDAIFTREPITFKLLNSKLENENIFMDFDTAFSMICEKIKLINGFDKTNTVGINISPLVARQNKKITEVIDGFILYLLKNTEFKILLVPHVIEDGNNDFEYMFPFFKKYKESDRIAILPDNLNAKQYKYFIANTRFFIGARTHATIAAYSSGVPTLTLGYSVKSRGISQYIFGIEKYVVDATKIADANCLIEAFNKLISEEDSIKTELEKLDERIKNNRTELAEKLKKQALK